MSEPPPQPPPPGGYQYPPFPPGAFPYPGAPYGAASGGQPNPYSEQLRSFWKEQLREIEQVPCDQAEFKNHQLPLARIKKIMKSDEDVRMISAEAPVLFAKACEMFILELTLRAWYHAEENKRRTLQRNDVAAAIARTDIFDFLVDIMPREDLKQEGEGGQAGPSGMGMPGGMPPGGPGAGGTMARPPGMYPYPYMPPPGAPGGPPGMPMDPSVMAGFPPGMPFPGFPGGPWPPGGLPPMPGQPSGGSGDGPVKQEKS